MSADPAVWQPLGEALGLILLGAVLLAVEFLIFSWGFLSVLAGICAVIAVLIAWSISIGTGLVFIVLCLVVGIIVARIASRLFRRTALVSHKEIGGDVGYRHLAEKLGVLIGSAGELVTDALPTGRARFGQNEVDVRVEGQPLARGAKVVVLRIEGPNVFVSAAVP